MRILGPILLETHMLRIRNTNSDFGWTEMRKIG